MTCRELSEFLNEYVSGELPKAQRAAFDMHLAECEDCVVYLRSYETTLELEKAAFKGEAIPGDVPEELVQAVLAARKRR